MTATKVVFLPSDIHSALPLTEDSIPVYEAGDGPSRRVLYSTGKLEAALEQGMHIWVLETGEEGRPCNQWWHDLLAKPGTHFSIINFRGYEEISSHASMAIMDKLYGSLGLAWDDSLANWFSAVSALPAKGVALGKDLKPSLKPLVAKPTAPEFPREAKTRPAKPGAFRKVPTPYT